MRGDFPHSPVHFHLPPCLELKPILSTAPWAETSLFVKAESPLTQGYSFILILLTFEETERWQNSTEHKQLELHIISIFKIVPPPSLTRGNDPINILLPQLFLSYKAVLILHSCVWLLGSSLYYTVLVSPHCIISSIREWSSFGFVHHCIISTSSLAPDLW